jgi:hypothetical protein
VTPTARPLPETGHPPTTRPPGVRAIFRHDLSGGQLLCLLSDTQAAADLTTALKAGAERDESFTSRPYALDDMGAVREVCAAVEIDVPASVQDALQPKLGGDDPRADATSWPRRARGLVKAVARARYVACRGGRRPVSATAPRSADGRYVPEVYTYLDLSTVHVPYDALNRDGGLNSVDGVIAYPYEYGAWLWVPPGVDERLSAHPDTPGYLIAIWRHARSLGCAFVRLDADGATSPRLARFEDSWR